MPTVAYIAAQQVLALIAVCNDDYVIQGWHASLLTMSFVITAIFFNTSAIGKLPILEGLVSRGKLWATLRTPSLTA